MSNGQTGAQGKAIDEAAIGDLKANTRGEVILAGDTGYDEARSVWNGMIDKRPAAVTVCTGVADVRRTLAFAREHDLPLAVRGGGHNVAGNSTCDDGIALDLSGMKGIRVDPARQTVRAQGGVTWGEFDHETHAFGLGTTGGLVSTTGIAGLTLGGGIGWLMRKHGLTCDNLVSADVVTADGAFVTASAEENSDLYWGLRGGGGNFGIVTSFEYQLHPVSQVLGGLIFYPPERMREVAQLFRETVQDAPDELTGMYAIVTAPPAPFIPAEAQGKPIATIVLCWSGDIAAGERAIAPLRAFGPPVGDLVGPVPYPAMQTILDATVPRGMQSYWKYGNVAELSDDLIDTTISHAAQMPAPLTMIHFQHFGGAMDRIGIGDTAYGHREARYGVNLVGMWPDRADNDSGIAWVKGLWQALEPHMTGGVYVNFLGDEGDDRVRAAYAPAIYERLVALKDKYDPTNVFRLNQNIRPSRRP